jgi:hypothetical protein
MGRFEPGADPRDSVKRGFYVPRPGRSLAEQLAGRFEVKPAASHLLVGGVGSGKTTQLLVARDRLEATGDVAAIYVDVSLRIEPNAMTSPDLLAVVGLELRRQIPTDRRTQEIDADLQMFEDYLDPQGVPWNDDPSETFVQTIERIRRLILSHHPHIVVLIDSLDRMSDLVRFSNLVDGAIRKLRSIGIGIILVGPLTSLYGIRRTIQDRFDRTWHLPSVDVQRDADGHAFLISVLRARDGQQLLTDAAAEWLSALSGGVLRDLVALTQTAGEEAYVDGADHVEVRHVETAAEVFGRKHLFAVDSEQLAVLQRVRTQGTFVQTSEKDLALLATRRVLEYANGHSRFAVHPTIEPLLAQIADTP